MDSIMEKVIKSIDDTEAMVQVDDSSNKRLRIDGGSHSIEGSSSKLILRKIGKRLVTFEKESTPPIPLAQHKTQDESATTLADLSPLTQSLPSTLTPHFAPFMLPSLTSGPIQPSLPSVEALGLLPWRDHFVVGQPLFSSIEIIQRWERDLPQALRECALPTS
ncbi:hypothetical protein PVK06_048700 [Gossypium arboreum]|uniref:Uncharacterized protein n=1 Tax=Gossypium arboreum TaxID=29729 RepID=A0ABR0MIL4_GOSAR|nr:hypothetical protein PVK06_048700 [Gossypium arboreum]